LTALQGAMSVNGAMLTYYFMTDLNQKDLDRWNLLIQDFIKLISDLVNKADNFDIDTLTSMLFSEFILFITMFDSSVSYFPSFNILK
jgi:hypothetical protein